MCSEKIVVRKKSVVLFFFLICERLTEIVSACVPDEVVSEYTAWMFWIFFLCDELVWISLTADTE